MNKTKYMGKISNFVILLAIAITSIATLSSSSCNGDNNDLLRDDIIGTWYGTNVNYHPSFGTKYSHLTLTLDENGIGSLEFEANSNYAYANFRYSISGGKIVCKGVMASTSDYGVEEDFEMTVSIEGDRLIPLNRFNQFILTKDDSVMTSDGQEVTDDSELLNRVWIRDDGKSILVIDRKKCTEYWLLQPYGRIYSQRSEAAVDYNIITHELYLDTDLYVVTLLTSDNLIIKNDKNTYVYNAGTKNDIPSNGSDGNQDEIMDILTLGIGWSSPSSSDTHFMFNFLQDGRVFYYETIYRYPATTLLGQGKFTLKGKQLTCNYTKVEWNYQDIAKDRYPGWTYGEPRTRVYTIKSISTESLWLVGDDGKNYYLKLL